MHPSIAFSRYAAGLTLLVTGVVASASAPASAPVKAVTAGPHTHTLFMGAEIAVQRGKEFFPIRDVSGESFVITVKGRPEFVPMRGAEVGLRFQQSLKLSARGAQIGGLKGERAYTPANDPHRRFASMASSAAGAAAAVDVAGGRVHNAEVAVHYARNSPDPQVLADALAAADGAVRDMGASAFSAGSDMNSVGSQAATLQAELARELYDAIQVSFDVSSEKPLNNPYVVVIARFREPDGKPGVVRNWIYAKSLPAVGPEPRNVHVLQGGFPPGFKLENYEVHLYERGREVSTNVAARRVPLTRDEAFEYLLLEHLAQHKGGAAPASPALVELPEDFHARVSGGQLEQPLYVKVPPTGIPAGVYCDQACTEPLADEYLTTVIQTMRFKPALAQGKPVESVARVRWNEL